MFERRLSISMIKCIKLSDDYDDEECENVCLFWFCLSEKRSHLAADSLAYNWLFR